MCICSVCKTPIPEPLQQFGPVHAPVCSTCWLAWGWHCPFCEHGRVGCPECDGEGGFDDEEAEYEWEECEGCGGKGDLRCDYCKGKWRITAEDFFHLNPRIAERLGRELTGIG